MTPETLVKLHNVQSFCEATSCTVCEFGIADGSECRIGEPHTWLLSGLRQPHTCDPCPVDFGDICERVVSFNCGR